MTLVRLKWKIEDGHEPIALLNLLDNVGDIFYGPNDDIIMMLVTDRHYYRLPKNVIKIVEFLKLLKLRIRLYDINYTRRHVFF